MRPKKRVLYVSPDEWRLSIQTFLLETRGFLVSQASSAEQALEILAANPPGTVDVLVTEWDDLPGIDGNKLARKTKRKYPALPVLLLSYKVISFDHETFADVFLPRGAWSQADLVERIRVLAARKRGPRKKLLPPAVYLPQMEERVVA